MDESLRGSASEGDWFVEICIVDIESVFYNLDEVRGREEGSCDEVVVIYLAGSSGTSSSWEGDGIVVKIEGGEVDVAASVEDDSFAGGGDNDVVFLYLFWNWLVFKLFEEPFSV